MAFREVGTRAVVKDIGKFTKDMDKVNKAMADATKKILAGMKKEINVRKSLEFSAKKVALAIESESIKRRQLDIAINNQIAKIDKLRKKHGDQSTQVDKATLSLDKMVVTYKKVALQTDILDDKFQDVGQSIDESEKRTDALGNELLELTTAATKAKIPIKEIAIGLAAIGAAVAIAVVAIKAITSAIKKLASIVLAPFKKVLEVLKSISASVTRFIVDLGRRTISATLRIIADSIRDAARAAVEGAVAFQKLSIRFQGLIAQEVIATGHVKDFDRAMKFASGAAKGLLQWMQKLALATPFTRRDITETVAFSTAMGFTTKQAKQLTLSIGNFVAGMGLSTEVMERVILQFGQMQAGGKLFGTELRDLARGAFVPVNTIIRRVAESAGMTATAWQELAATGKTDIQPFFDEFITLVGERFPNAMERMNKTMEAVIQNAGEFVKEFLGVKLLLPAIEKISERAAKALESVVSDEVLKAFELAGLRVGGFVDRIIDLVGVISEAILGTRDFRQMAITLAAFLAVVAEKASRLVDIVDDKLIGFAEGIGDSAKDAFQWGVDLIVEFSRGIIVSTSGVLVQAMQFVGDMLSKWLKGSSPPLVAPDLPLWGASALTEWLKGMTLADFSVLEGLQAPLKRALGVLEDAGQIAEEDVAAAFTAISTGLIEALSGGEVGQDVFDLISQSLGDFGDDLNELIRIELDLQHAIQAVAQAERDLENARRGFTDQSLEVRKLTREYNELLRTGSDPAILRAKLAEINAAEEAREVAREQVRESEGALEAAEDRVGPLQDQVRLQEAILRQLIAMTEAQFDFDVSDSVEEAERSIGELIAEMGSVGVSMGEIETAFLEARQTIVEAWTDMFSGLREAWEGDITDAFDGLKTQFEHFKFDVIDPFLVALGLKEAPTIEGLVAEQIEAAMAGDVEKWKRIAERIEELRERLGGRVFLPPGGMGTFPEERKSGLEGFLDSLPGIIDEIAEQLTFIGGDLEDVWDGVGEIVDNVTESVGLLGDETGETPGIIEALFFPLRLFVWWLKQTTKFLEITTGAAKEFWKAIDRITKLEWFGMVSEASPFFQETLREAEEESGDIVNRVEQDWKNLKRNLIDNSIVPDMLDGIVTEFRDKFAEIETIIDDFALKFTDTFKQLGVGFEGEAKVGGSIKDKMKSATVTAPPTSNQTSVSFGDTNINDQMDAATFMARVQQAVAGGL